MYRQTTLLDLMMSFFYHSSELESTPAHLLLLSFEHRPPEYNSRRTIRRQSTECVNVASLLH